MTGLAFDPTAKVRTADFNSYTNMPGVSLLYFTTGILKYITLNNTKYELYNTMGSTGYLIR